MFNFLIKNGITSGSIKENDMEINCVWKKGKPVGLVEIKTSALIYKGKYIENNEICENAVIKYFQNNEFYEGSVINKNGIFTKHGTGKFTTKDLKIFSGIWENDVLSSGVMDSTVYKNLKYRYEGEFDILTPIKGIYYIDNLTFVGKILDTNVKYVIINGSVKYSKFKIEGIVTYPNGDTFEGILEDMKEIKGKKIYKNNDTLVEINGCLENGSYKDMYSAKYKSGCILDRKKDSYTFILPSATKICFDYIHHQKGFGKIYYSNNSSYIGIVKHNINVLKNGITEFSKDGRGIWNKNDGVIIETFFENDLIKNDSEVKETTATGEIFFYVWSNNSRNGEGYIQVGNFIKKVVWLNGNPIEDEIIVIPENLVCIKCPYCKNEECFEISKNKILKSDINENNVCYENPVNMTFPKCRHTFCETCILIVKQHSLP
uniref:RING-type domain-containing protein n=1 Tax=viral metagenome TaxID=1070528 RepID=A0A6C0AGB0_9ZZZZ